jgi:putative sigma-54 modulation protein
MHVEIKGVHLEITDAIRDFIDKKMHKLDFASESLIDLLFTFTKEKSHIRMDATINFRWGNQAHVSTDSYDMNSGIDTLFDKVVSKVTKEKEKIQQH